MAFDESQLSEEDRNFLASAKRGSRQKGIANARAMLPAVVVMMVVGFGPTLLLLLVGYISVRLTVLSFVLGLVLAVALHKHLGRR